MTIKSESEIAKIKASAHIVHETIEFLRPLIQAGVTTKELNDKAETFIVGFDARPAFKNYTVGNLTYKYATCMSKNSAVVHGMPNDEALRDGDIISVDVGVEKDGWFGDGAYTFAVGEVKPEIQKLLKVTQESLQLGVAAAKSGNRLYDISKAIQDHCQSNGFSIVRDLVGHGIGEHLHEEPQVPNYVPSRIERGFKNIELKEGMTIAIEPMVNLGGWKVRTLSDGWTVVAADGKPSAHFEHTVVIRPFGGEILTA
ncbi:MAG TPA: type I methionyl aminopeptidase [Candidatus Kapabacteria bacterium]|nr:type I methionyl aminopeptidase [Candidatus Kapabacteria bacterium]